MYMLCSLPLPLEKVFDYSVRQLLKTFCLIFKFHIWRCCLPQLLHVDWPPSEIQAINKPLLNYVKKVFNDQCKTLFNKWLLYDTVHTVEPRFNEPLYILGLMNDIFQPSDSYMCGKEPRYNEPISPVSWHFVKSRFHCNNYRLLHC